MIRTLIAEPVTLTREGLVALLGRETDIELAATVRSREKVLATARAVRPDVALLAAAFADRDGINVAAGMHAAVPTAEIATVLRLFEGTVRNYLSRAIAKTGARNRVGAIRVAAKSGWL